MTAYHTTLAAFANDTSLELHSLNASPMFRNIAASEFGLSTGSPAIDAGTNLVAGIGGSDLGGNPRIADGKNTGIPVIDMGAYEFARIPKPTNLTLIN